MSHAHDSSGTATPSPSPFPRPSCPRRAGWAAPQASRARRASPCPSGRAAPTRRRQARSTTSARSVPRRRRASASTSACAAPAPAAPERVSHRCNHTPQTRWPFSTRAKGEAKRLGSHEKPFAFEDMQPRRSAVCGLCFIIRVARSSRARRASCSRAPWRRAASSVRPAASRACGGRNGADFRQTQRQKQLKPCCTERQHACSARGADSGGSPPAPARGRRPGPW